MRTGYCRVSGFYMAMGFSYIVDSHKLVEIHTNCF